MARAKDRRMRDRAAAGARGTTPRIPTSTGLRAKVEDAEFLYLMGRIESAWTLALISVAATARKRYSGDKDSECYRRFSRDIAAAAMTGEVPAATFPVEIQFGSPGNSTPLSEILYNQLRCTLLHEAEMPATVKFSRSTVVDGRLVAKIGSADRSEGRPIELPDFFVLNLLAAVRAAPENAGIF